MKINLGKAEFNCSLPLIVLYCGLLSLLISLAFWQFHRAEEKRLLLQQQATQISQVLHLTAETPDNPQSLRYRPAYLSGHYDHRQQFLLDNQMLNHKVGYFVFTPFILENSHKAILVNRGWLPANLNRKVLPNIALQNLQTQQINGRINTFPSVGIQLADVDKPSNTTPAVIQHVNSTLLVQQLGYPLFSFQLELDAKSADGYTRQWLTTTLMLPEQHIAYAIQWASLATALTFLFFWNSIKKTHNG
jgi:surfeit locus 1 family protein